MNPHTLLAKLAEPWPDDEVPPLDRQTITPAGQLEAAWVENGAVILPRFIPDDLIAAYRQEWLDVNVPTGKRVVFADGTEMVAQGTGDWRPGGWPDCTPYMRHQALLDLCCWGPLQDVLQRLIGQPMGVHLNLTGWVSTQRDWHQDGYLNPDSNRDHYAAVWIALDDIGPNCGPFQWVPGSHRRWPPIRQDRMLAMLRPDERDHTWPKHSERILSPMFAELYGGDVEAHASSFQARTGDVLIWHARTLHRGSPPRDPNALRPALIAHYSGVSSRPDMPAAAVQHRLGGWWFPIEGGPVR